MIENEIMPGVDLNIILSINCDKYAERVLNYNPPRSQKIKDLNKSLGNHEVNNPNDRDSLLKCFHENNNWKTPSKEDKKNFPLWREDHFDRLQKYFKSKLDDDEMPMEYWKNWESSRVLDLLNEQPYFTVFYNIATRQLTQDFFLLAHVIGMIDHLKAVQKLTKKNIISAKKATEYDFNFGHKSIYLGFLFTRTTLNDPTAENALKSYSTNTSFRKLATMSLSKADLSKSQGCKKANTMHRKCLLDTIEFIKVENGILNGKNKESAITELNAVITAFDAKIERDY